jgi:hypothetical protein
MTAFIVFTAVSYCEHNGQQYDLGQEVVNCEDICMCQEDGSMACTPLCSSQDLPDVPEGCVLAYPKECGCEVVVRCPNQSGELYQLYIFTCIFIYFLHIYINLVLIECDGGACEFHNTHYMSCKYGFNGAIYK